MSKNELRRSALMSRRSLSMTEVSSLSEQVKARLFQLPEYASAKTVAGYAAKSDEVQTARIIEASLAEGKRVLVPRSDPASNQLVFAELRSMAELVPGHFGVLEPPPAAPTISLDESELVLVPVVAWDEVGHRIGYGKGYFDRALASNKRPLRVGLALESQKYTGVPHSATDVDLDMIVTERRVIRFGRRQA